LSIPLDIFVAIYPMARLIGLIFQNIMRYLLSKLSNGVKDNQNDIILIIGVILISLISFGAGCLYEANFPSPAKLDISDVSQIEKLTTQLPNKKKSETEKDLQEQKSEALQIQIIGNKNSKVYHYPWCSGAKNMREENKVFFNSIKEAQEAGFRPAGNCPGL